MKRITIYIEDDDYGRIATLADLEKRKVSPMGAILVQEALNTRWSGLMSAGKFKEAAAIRPPGTADTGSPLPDGTGSPPSYDVGTQGDSVTAGALPRIMTGTHCSVCGEPQFKTAGGDTCENGHGGAPAKEDLTDPVEAPK